MPESAPAKLIANVSAHSLSEDDSLLFSNFSNAIVKKYLKIYPQHDSLSESDRIHTALHAVMSSPLNQYFWDLILGFDISGTNELFYLGLKTTIG